MNSLKKYRIAILLILGVTIAAITFQYLNAAPPEETATSRPVEPEELGKTVQSVAAKTNTLSARIIPDQQKPKMTSSNERAVTPEEDAASRIPNELQSIKQGIAIVSIEDQPIPEEFKEMTRKFKREMDTQGYAVVPEDQVIEIERQLSDEHKNKLKQVPELVKKLTFEPTDLDEIPSFKGGKFLGGIEEGGNVDGKWTGLTRLYKIPGLGTVKLEESDYVTAKSGIQLSKELINSDVNGNPAIYTASESASGKALTNIEWVTKNKEYNLSVDQNAAKIKGLKDNLLDLAHSITVE